MSFTLGSTGGKYNQIHTLEDAYANIGYWGGQGGGVAFKSAKRTANISPDCGWSLGNPSADKHSGTTVVGISGNTDESSTLQPYISVNIWRRVS